MVVLKSQSATPVVIKCNLVEVSKKSPCQMSHCHVKRHVNIKAIDIKAIDTNHNATRFHIISSEFNFKFRFKFKFGFKCKTMGKFIFEIKFRFKCKIMCKKTQQQEAGSIPTCQTCNQGWRKAYGLTQSLPRQDDW